jgi:hypothetical protein
MARNSNDTTAYLDCGAASALQFTLISVSMWVRQTSAALFQKLMHYSASNELRGYGIYLDFSSGNIPIFFIGDGTKHTVDSTSALSLNTWTHIGGTYDGTTLRFYFNGAAAGTTSYSGTISYTGVQNFTLMNLPASISNTQGFLGDVAEVAVWGVVLDAAEMDLLGHGYCPALIRPYAIGNYWPLIGRYSPEIGLRGTGDGTINGTITAAVHSRVYQRRKTRTVMVPTVAVAGNVPYDLAHQPQHQAIMAM